MTKRIQAAAAVKDVKIDDGFWGPVQRLILDVVIPYQKRILEDQVPGAEKSHAIENFRIAAGRSKGEHYGLVFQDSDFAKWLEAASCSLALRPDPALRGELRELFALIRDAQEEDGYLDTYFILKEPDKKWQALEDCHELYCAGHMIEAAVTCYEAAGETDFLNTMRKTADLICSRFGEGKVRGIPGHQEIELALLRLYSVTGEKSYLETARYFLNERGTEPDYFIEESERLTWHYYDMDPRNRAYAQNHAPVREQDRAVGHAVRAVYMYTAMAFLAAETGDGQLAAACRRLWDNITERQMYVTGGIGATVHGEAFSADYELPNDLVYAETCASVGMAFFARRMLELSPEAKYGDILEKELYNGILSGMQLDGKRFFYVNPLETVPGVSGVLPEYKHVLPSRPEWYACACCPPNVARILTSLGQYAWGENSDTVYAHLYLGGRARFKNGAEVSCRSSYPAGGEIVYTMEQEKTFTFAVRIPGWCREWALSVNGEAVSPIVREGYAYISRLWRAGDSVSLTLSMEPRRIYANTRVRADAGCVALARGPVVYCFEEADNGENLSALRLPRGARIQVGDAAPGGLPSLTMTGLRLSSGEGLYSETPPEEREVPLRAVPYYAWGNRETKGMRVWLLEAQECRSRSNCPGGGLG